MAAVAHYTLFVLLVTSCLAAPGHPVERERRHYDGGLGGYGGHGGGGYGGPGGHGFGFPGLFGGSQSYSKSSASASSSSQSGGGHLGGHGRR